MLTGAGYLFTRHRGSVHTRVCISRFVDRESQRVDKDKRDVSGHPCLPEAVTVAQFGHTIEREAVERSQDTV